MMDRIGIVLKVVTAEVFQVTVVVEDAMEPLGIGILDMAEPTHTLWVEIKIQGSLSNHSEGAFSKKFSVGRN